MANRKKFKADQTAKLDPKEVIKYNVFLDALMRGATRKEAAICAGVSAASAGAWSTKAWNSDHVQKRYRELISKLDAKNMVLLQDVVLGLLTEARNNDKGASHAARVNAWKGIAELLDYYPQKDVSVAVSSGVMLVPVMPASVEEWEKAALEHQQKLKQQNDEG